MSIVHYTSGKFLHQDIGLHDGADPGYYRLVIVEDGDDDNPGIWVWQDDYETGVEGSPWNTTPYLRCDSVQDALQFIEECDEAGWLL